MIREVCFEHEMTRYCAREMFRGEEVLVSYEHAKKICKGTEFKQLVISTD